MVDHAQSINLRDNPQLDAEALFLSAAMWSRDSAGLKKISEHLTPDSFHNPVYGQIFDVIADNATNGKPVDPATVRGELIRRGTGPSTTSALIMLATLGANDLQMKHYAVEVSSQAYRRSYRRLAASMEHAAAYAPEGDLFNHLVNLGRQQRERWNSHRSFFEAMGLPVEIEVDSGPRLCADAVVARALTETVAAKPARAADETVGVVAPHADSSTITTSAVSAQATEAEL